MARDPGARLMSVERIPRWRRADLPVLAILLGLSLALGVGAIVRRPDITANEAFLFADPALNLIAAGRALAGGRIYLDAAFQYGPVSIYAYTWFATLVGNSPRGYLAFLLIWSLVSVVLAYGLLRLRVSTGTAAIVCAGLLTTILIPGALAGALLSSTYIPMERALLLLLALAWAPPHRRTTKRAVLTGLVLGSWQGVRFGAAVFAGAGVVLVDLLALWSLRADGPSLRRWMQTNLVTLGVFLVVEAAWILHAFATLPRHAAIDLVWPAYILESYLIAPPGTRWIAWSGAKYFFGQLLLPVIGLVATIVVLAWVARPAWRPRRYRESPGLLSDDLRLMIPPMFFLVGGTFYFRTVWHFQQFFWTLLFPVGLLLAHRGWTPRAAFLVLAAPGLGLIVRAMLLTPIPATSVALDTPRGDRLWVPSSTPTRVERIVAAATTPMPGPGVGRGSMAPALFIVPMGTGIHYFYNLEMPTRQSWFIPGFGRPADEAAMLRILSTRPAIVVVTDHEARPSRNPCEWYRTTHFREGFCEPLGRLLGPAERIDSTTWLIRNDPVRVP